MKKIKKRYENYKNLQIENESHTKMFFSKLKIFNIII